MFYYYKKEFQICIAETGKFNNFTKKTICMQSSKSLKGINTKCMNLILKHSEINNIFNVCFTFGILEHTKFKTQIESIGELIFFVYYNAMRI